ncbi:ribonuclease M5 [Paucilactobacillus wasatchensis]|uniref:Ribonuclease M5 n=1 Tax=Paucilactobacillus wasatchensis TaxID=1335616 RepID=A0A0D0Y7B4_9LACO|nr:ribonuclease M5 [Paucilactobacillus wasatchensis]KIS04148.1 Ribonuclease M5 [Paucilactobacillus wasatchensis]
MKKIKEIIVVEGKDDTKRIAQAVNADTFETNGSALSSADIARLKQLQQKRGLIVFTDPDFNGERIRKMIADAIPGVKHAFIKRREGVPDVAGGSLGVEHASATVILAALQNVYTQELIPHEQTFSALDLRTAQLINDNHARLRRERLGEILGIGYGNGKQLLKRLNLFQISQTQFADAIKQLDQEENNE